MGRKDVQKVNEVNSLAARDQCGGEEEDKQDESSVQILPVGDVPQCKMCVFNNLCSTGT